MSARRDQKIPIVKSKKNANNPPPSSAAFPPQPVKPTRRLRKQKEEEFREKCGNWKEERGENLSAFLACLLRMKGDEWNAARTSAVVAKTADKPPLAVAVVSIPDTRLREDHELLECGREEEGNTIYFSVSVSSRERSLPPASPTTTTDASLPALE